MESVVATMDDSQVRTYELRYAIRDCVTWQLPIALRTLRFRLKIDSSEVAETLPLPNPLSLNFEVR